MFTFDLPSVEVSTSSFNLEGDIRFDPPVYEQRYSTVIQVLEHSDFESQLKKVVDFGCSEMRLLWLLRRTKGIEHIVESTKTSMEENGEPYSFELNFDFLDSTTTNTKNATIIPEYHEQSQINSTYDIESLATRIATVNDMAIQMNATKDDNLRLQKQMQELSESAMSIRNMYDQEKNERLKFTKLYRELQEKHKETESQLTNITLNYEQMQSKLEEEVQDKKPISYCDLALKYQRLALQLDEEKQLHSKEKIILQQVKEYLESKKLQPLPVIKKKSNTQRVKGEVRDFAMQYDTKIESESKETQCSLGYSAEEEPKDTCTQGTQYTWYTTTRGTNTPASSNTKPELKTQGTQYISSTTTRGTSTSTFIKTQSVGTIFPEPVPPVSIEDIFKEMIFDVSPLSPMTASPQHELKEEKIEMKTIGTCTDLKNVRKPIEYVSANIKHSDSRPPSRNNNPYDRVKNEIPLMMGMPTFNPFAGLGIPVTPIHNTVTELWNMLGHTIFTLLQQNGGAAATAQINPMHMNVLNDRMRNLRNRPPSEEQRSCETRDNYFEHEYQREYSTVTRSAATSPILHPELQINQPQSRSSFESAEAERTSDQQQLLDIQKIMLHKNLSDPVVSTSSKKSSQVDEILQLFPEYSDSFKKRKAIKRLLKEANKNKKPKKKRNSTSSSSSISASDQFSTSEVQTRQGNTVSVPMAGLLYSSIEIPQIKPHVQSKWKKEVFGDCDSDSSVDNTIIDYIETHSPQVNQDQKWTPIETKSTPNDLEWPVSSSKFEAKHTPIKSTIEEEFFEFDKEINLPPPTTDELFCKPFSLPKRQKSVVSSGAPFTQDSIKVDPNISRCSLKTKIEPSMEESQSAKPPNPKRKRRTKKTDAKQTNKIYKVDGDISTLPELETPIEPKKPKRSLSLNKTKNKININLPIEVTTSFAPVNKPLKTLNLNKIKKPKEPKEPKEFVYAHLAKSSIESQNKKIEFNKPDWMNKIKNPEVEEDDLSVHISQNHHRPMVMKVEKPPDSVFEDIKTCFSNQKQDSIVQDIKTCLINPTTIKPKQERDVKPFIGPIMPNQQTATEANGILEKQSIPHVAPIEDGTFRFLLQSNPPNSINTNNMINSSSINPENSLKILNYYDNNTSQENTPITVLNEHWTAQPNDLIATKQENLPSLVPTTDVSRPLDDKTLDLENMPIYFIDDKSLLQNTEQIPNETHTQNLSILPGFQEIQRGLKAGHFIVPPNCGFQNEKLRISTPNRPMLSNLPVIVQDYPISNTIESMPIGRDVKPMVPTQQKEKTSYLVLNHQKQLLDHCKESSICTRIEEKMEQELEVISTGINNIDDQTNVNTNETTGLPALNPLNEQYKDLSRSKMPKDETDPTIQKRGEYPSLLLLQNQSLLGSKILGGTKYNEEIPSDDRRKVSEIIRMQSPLTIQPLSTKFLTQKVVRASSLEPKINNIKTYNSGIEDYHQKPESPLHGVKATSKSPIISVTTTTKKNDDLSSDSECDLSIDFPPSPSTPPPPPTPSHLDLSAILKTPEEADNHHQDVEFKTPGICLKNDSLITKVITNSTEKLVEDYLTNECPGKEGPTFQIFLDRILDDVAPPSSPISALALSEKPQNCSETESSCDEGITTPKRYKRNRAPTAAIAVKRSARINAKKIATATTTTANSMVNRLCSITVPNIELGKYTRKKTNNLMTKQEKPVEPIKEEKISIQMGFFQEAINDEEDERPTCEPIGRHSVERLNAVDETVLEENSTNNPDAPKRKSETEIIGHSVKSRLSTNIDDQQKLYSPVEIDPYLSLSKKTKESISSYLKSEELITDSSINSSCTNFDDSSLLYDESPASPPPSDQMPSETHTIPESFEPNRQTDMIFNRKTVISHLIANYNHKHHTILDKGQKLDKRLLAVIQDSFKNFISGLGVAMDAIRCVNSLLQLTSDEKLISRAIVDILKLAPRPETEVTGPIPDTYLSHTHRKLLILIQPLCHHYANLNCNLQATIEQTLFTFTKEVIPVEVLLNLTQFYLAIINNPSAGLNPARLFICKCLYFFNVKSIPMIYHTLCVYPTVLPHKVDPTYDRSDIIISTIQSILMSTYYDPEKCDFMNRQILAKLRMFYNYESFKPPRDEVIENMIAKIRTGRFRNVSYALSVICKRMEQAQTEKFILNERFIPLANEFYQNLSSSSENDEKIACVLECISFVIKPFSVDTDISQYVNLFSRFLNAAIDRKIIQEAAVAAIIRTSRFGYVQCFNAIYNFQPTYELSDTLKLMLQSFIYKKGKVFLKALEQQARELVAK